ncbi:MAG: aufA [Myxococcaceae bacterium]|nr:aufA [Myxococcaceae bacterium]
MSEVSSAVVSSATRSPAVDPRIMEIIKDASAPAAVPPQVMPSRSLPGTSSLLGALRTAYGMVRRGAAYGEEMHARFGDVFRSRFGPLHIVLVSDPEEVAKIARNESGVWSTAMGWDTMLEGIDTTVGNGGALLQLDFEAHRAARRLVQPAFTTKAIKGYVELAQRGIDDGVAGWVRRGRVDFKPEVRALLATIANQIFTGIHDPAQVAHIDRSMKQVWRGLQTLLKNPRLSHAFRDGQRGFRALVTLFEQLAPERRARPGIDLFSQLCQSEEAGTDTAIARVFLAIMLAAYDTTAFGVTSMAYLLAKHPEWQERLRQEALGVRIGSLEWADLQKLEQLDWAWKETLRLMPVTTYLPRRALREVEVLGHRLAPGTFVGALIGPTGRDARYWREPLKFDPERFSPARAEDKSQPGVYMPFGGGAHACIGMQLAGIEAKLLFHALLTSCRFELEKDYQAEHTYTPLGAVSGKVALRLVPL